MGSSAEPDEGWPIGAVEVHVYRVTHLRAELFVGVSLGEEEMSQRACDEAAFGRIFDQKNDFAHAAQGA
jgi:hypothetical protein